MSHPLLNASPVEDLSEIYTLAPARGRANLLQRILVVDDDKDIRQLISQFLIRSGYEVDIAEDGAAGWKMLHAVRYDPESYDLLITDNNMPNMSGLELIKRVRSERMILPIILASGSEPVNTQWLQLAAVLPKPFSPDQLVQTVQEALHWSSLILNKGDHPRK